MQFIVDKVPTSYMNSRTGVGIKGVGITTDLTQRMARTPVGRRLQCTDASLPYLPYLTNVPPEYYPRELQ